jgi:hypothetical protein
MRSSLAFLFAFLAAGAFASSLQPLDQNGCVFTQSEMPLPLHVLRADGILDLGRRVQNDLLNDAAAVGFNAITFNLKFFGQGGLFPEGKDVDGQRLMELLDLIGRMDERSLYVFPLLWTPEEVRDFEKSGSGEAGSFWTADWSRQEQEHMVSTLAKSLDAQERPWASEGLVGGWVLYRGPMPGQGPLRSWMKAQSALLKKFGCRQLEGLETAFHPESGTASVFRQELWGATLDSPLQFLLLDLPQPADPDQVQDWAAFSRQRLGIGLIPSIDWASLESGQRTTYLSESRTAGLLWDIPVDSFPDPAKSLWLPPEPRKRWQPAPLALFIRHPKAFRGKGQVSVSFTTNRPATAELRFGGGYPLKPLKDDGTPRANHHFSFPWKGGEPVVQIQADSAHWGQAATKPSRMELRSEKGGGDDE